MLRLVLRKMTNNKWLMVCLLIGSILAVAMVSSVPMYTDGVLQRMLIKDLEDYQIRTNQFPGSYTASGNFYYTKADLRLAAYNEVSAVVEDEFTAEIPLPLLSETKHLTIDYISFIAEDLVEALERKEKGVSAKTFKIAAIENAFDHLDITNGRLPSAEAVDGIYEVIVSQAAMKNLGIFMDTVYVVRDNLKRGVEFSIKVVGVYAQKENSGLFWYPGARQMADGLLMDYGLATRTLVNVDPTLLTSAKWYRAYDYHAMTLENMPSFVQAIERQQEQFKSRNGMEVNVQIMSILKTYEQRELQLRTTLWVLQVPILMMLAFYIFMVAQLIIEYERNEIAVLKSRGASGSQMLYTYFLQSLIINGLAFIAGPLLSVELCRMIGASNGFLEFVQRASLPIMLRPKALMYAGGAVVLSMMTMLLPAFISSRATIVEHKQKKARKRKTALWKKLCLDIVLIGVSLYGLYMYQQRAFTLMLTGADVVKVPLDPALFLMSTLFILGCGLFLLRIYPFIVRFVFFVFRRLWSPALYASFIHVGRSGGQEQFLMLFLVLTLSVGIFSANAARTINLNVEEKINYQMGADLVIKTEWQNNKPPETMSMGGEQSTEQTNIKVLYKEPPFSLFENLETIPDVAKVFVKNKAQCNLPTGRNTRVNYMSIIPHEFGNVVWYRDGLLPYHINEYLNLLTDAPNSVIVSNTLKEAYELALGDTLYISWEDSDAYIPVIIGAFVQYWPKMNPYDTQGGNQFVIGNFDHMLSRVAIEPYEIWGKRKDGATSEEVYAELAEIADGKANITSVADSKQELIEMKNDPMLQGLNGALTMGFMVTLAVSAIGFMIYWILSVKSRVLQFGIFRAMGLFMRNIITMLISEQILISGISILCGVIIGGIACDLFVPMLQIAYSTIEQVPPFKVVASIQDYNRIYTFVLSMLAAGFAILGLIISRIRISQALKLGED